MNNTVEHSLKKNLLNSTNTDIINQTEIEQRDLYKFSVKIQIQSSYNILKVPNTYYFLFGIRDTYFINSTLILIRWLDETKNNM